MVLIETYWNVKEEKIGKLQKTVDVLIETYWNVKYESGGWIIDFPGINRNILECKVDLTSGFNAADEY